MTCPWNVEGVVSLSSAPLTVRGSFSRVGGSETKLSRPCLRRVSRSAEGSPCPVDRLTCRFAAALPRALLGQPGLLCAVGPLARWRGSAQAAAVSGGGAGRAVHRRERCTGVDSRERNTTMQRAHTFGLPADHAHQTHQWHVQAIMSPFTVNQPTASRHP